MLAGHQQSPNADEVFVIDLCEDEKPRRHDNCVRDSGGTQALRDVLAVMTNANQIADSVCKDNDPC